MSKDPVDFLKSQKTAIDEKINEMSERCKKLRKRQSELLDEKAVLKQSHVTIDDFIECFAGAIEKKKQLYPTHIINAFKNDAFASNILEKPTFEKMNNEQLLANLSFFFIQDIHTQSMSLGAIFYILNDLIIEGFKKALKESVIRQNQTHLFKNGKPMKEITSRINEIDEELVVIGSNLDELMESANLFGVSI